MLVDLIPTGGTIEQVVLTTIVVLVLAWWVRRRNRGLGNR